MSLKNQKLRELSCRCSLSCWPVLSSNMQTHASLHSKLHSHICPLLCLRGSLRDGWMSPAMATFSWREAQLHVLSGADFCVIKVAIESGENKVRSLKLYRSLCHAVLNSSEVWLTHSGLKLGCLSPEGAPIGIHSRPLTITSRFWAHFPTVYVICQPEKAMELTDA